MAAAAAASGPRVPISSPELTLLIQRCRAYSSDRTDKKKAMSNLQSLLEKRATGEITSEKVLDHVRAALNVADNPIFEATFGSTAKKRFEEARDLMNTL